MNPSAGRFFFGGYGGEVREEVRRGRGLGLEMWKFLGSKQVKVLYVLVSVSLLEMGMAVGVSGF